MYIYIYTLGGALAPQYVWRLASYVALGLRSLYHHPSRTASGDRRAAQRRPRGGRPGAPPGGGARRLALE